MHADHIIKKSILLFLPEEGFNELEFSVVKRSLEHNGYRIFIASDAVWACRGNLGLRVKADVSLYNVNHTNFSGIILIGGDGVRNYWNNGILQGIVKKFSESDKVVAAICGAPVVLARAGLLQGKSATCFGADKKELLTAGAEFTGEETTTDGNIITGMEPASADSFAAAIINRLTGDS